MKGGLKVEIIEEYGKEESLRQVFSQVMRLHFIRTHSLLEETGLYPGQPPLLFSLSHKNGQSQRELADNLKVKPSTVTVMIKRMEKTALIERKQDEDDQRISRIFITDEGREICNELISIYDRIENEAFANFTPEEKVILRRLLMQLRENLEEVCNKEKSKAMDFCNHHR